MIFSIIFISLFVISCGRSFRDEFGHNRKPPEQLLIEILDFYQSKLIANETLTEKQERILNKIMHIVFEQIQVLIQRRMKENTVYWYSRQG